jgi:hypothetical protein
VNLTDFKQIVYRASQLAGAQVLSLHEPEVTPNFFAAKLCLHQESFYLLCNHDDVWAYSRHYQPETMSLSFIEVPALSAALKVAFNIIPLTSAQLNAPFLKQPGQSQADISYWKPQTLGAGHFHGWD